MCMKNINQELVGVQAQTQHELPVKGDRDNKTLKFMS